MALLEEEVPIRNVITIDPTEAKALENDIRAKILSMLTDEALTIEEIHEELRHRHEAKAETTIRHHVNVLKDAGLIELARLEGAGGGTRKYYKSNTRLFSYDFPDDADTMLADASALAQRDIAALVERMFNEHGNAIEAVAENMDPYDYSSTQYYREFIVRELVTQALTDLSEDDDMDLLS